MELSVVVERVVGVTYLLIGMSLLIRNFLWLELCDEIMSNSHIRTYLLTFFALPFGLVIITTHNQWEWSPAVIVTIFGWSAFLKAFIHLLFPGFIHKLAPKRERWPLILRIEGIMLIILCTFVIAHSFNV